MALHVSTKHVQVNKAQSTMLATVAIAAVLSIFGLFGIKSMLSKAAYQQRVLSAKNQVVAQLKSNITAANKLVGEYNTFVAQDPNVLGGRGTGTGSLDGPNSQIVLDALPGKYDAPALASSLDKLLQGESVSNGTFQVKDDPASNPDQPLAKPTPHIIPASISAQGSYAADQKLLKDFERSIRPFDATSLSLSGNDSGLTLQMSMNTYYQPAKSLDLSNTKVVK